MRTSPFRACCQLALLVLLALTSVVPASLYAQDQPPTTNTASSGAAQNQPKPERTDAEARINQPFAPQAPATAETADTSVSAEPGVEETAPSAATPLDTPATEMQPAGVQGIIGLDVSSPDTIRAGDYITYTYAYTSSTSVSTSGIEIELIWANAMTSKTTSSNVTQHCPATPDPITENCGLLPDSVQGPTIEVTRAPALSGTSVGMRVRLAALAAGQSGRFSVRLRSNALKYPKTGESITRPTSSAKLYLSGQATPTSEDTANTMIIGPVFVLTKTPKSTDKIYPVRDTAEFVIKIGNASAPGDIVGGQPRPDATTATNVTLTDTFPLGTEFVSATPSGTINGTTITWKIPSLAVGQALEFTIVFRKLDNNTSCDRVSNRTYNVTSDQMPMNGATRYTVPGDTANIDLVTPLVVRSIVATPGSVVFGDEATLTITVQNFWDQALNGVVLNYDIQANAAYIAGTANPTATTSPTPGQPGGRISWNFSIGAGTKTTPVEKTFSLKVRAGYTITGIGTAQIIAPSGVPAACIKTKTGNATLRPRLLIEKDTETDPETMIGSVYIVNQGQQFWYYIDVTNNGVADAVGVDISDRLPGEWGANFAYVQGSATLNNQRLDPDSFVNGPSGSILWNDLYVPAGSTLRIRYALQVNGYYYVQYCNLINGSNDSETVSFGNRKVCVKINPQIEVTKTANKTSGSAGEEVEFTLTLTNRESATFHVGLFDYLDKFVYVRQVSGYAQPTLNPDEATLAWPLVDLPAGQQLTAVIVAKLPDPCVAATYDNEVLFQADIGGGTEAVIQPIPRVKAKVSCARLEYTKTVDRTTISLGDRHMYTISVKNADPAGPISNVVVDDMLPQGFSYVSMDANSGVKSAPTQSPRADGRTKLSWTIPSLGANITVTIKFIATSGSVVGNHTNWVVASVGGVPGTCKSACITEDGTGIVFATKSLSVQAMITVEPSIVQTACAKPGDLRTYRLTVVNTNVHAYTNTSITGTLPFGLSYVRTIGASPQPRVITDSAGATKLTWFNQTIPAKPSNAFGSQVILEVEVLVGQVWGELVTVEQVTSPDGLIPRKDGVQNAAVVVCPAQPSIAKEVNRHIVRVGDEVRYMISLANTNSTDLNVTVQDQLPANISYLGAVSGGTPTVSGRTLTWNVTIPKAVNGKAGSTLIIFRARVDSGQAGTSYPNTVTLTAGGSGFDTTKNTMAVVVANSILYFPYLQ